MLEFISENIPLWKKQKLISLKNNIETKSRIDIISIILFNSSKLLHPVSKNRF